MTITTKGLVDERLKLAAVPAQPVEIPPPNPPLDLVVTSIKPVNDSPAPHYEVETVLTSNPVKTLTFRVGTAIGRSLVERFVSEPDPVAWSVDTEALTRSWAYCDLALTAASTTAATTQENSRRKS